MVPAAEELENLAEVCLDVDDLGGYVAATVEESSLPELQPERTRPSGCSGEVGGRELLIIHGAQRPDPEPVPEERASISIFFHQVMCSATVSRIVSWLGSPSVTR